MRPFVAFTSFFVKMWQENRQGKSYLCYMKKFLVVVTLLSLLFACDDKKNTIDLRETFQSDSLHFSINYPSNYEVLKNPKDGQSIAIVRKIGNDNKQYRDNMVCWTEEMPMAISDSVYLQASITQLKISNPALSILKQPAQQLGPHLFSAFSFEYQAKNDSLFTVNGFCLVKGQRGYNFSCTALTREMPEKMETFKKILSSFQPL